MFTSVDVTQEDITKDPETFRVVRDNAADTITRARRDCAEVDRVRRDGELLAAKSQRHSARNRGARERIESCTDGRARVLGARDSSVNLLHVGGVADHESRAGVDANKKWYLESNKLMIEDGGTYIASTLLVKIDLVPTLAPPSFICQ